MNPQPGKTQREPKIESASSKGQGYGETTPGQAHRRGPDGERANRQGVHAMSTTTPTETAPDIATDAQGTAEQEQEPEPVELPQVGALMKRGKEVGQVVDRWLGTVYLRPVGGGKEWTARPEELEPASASDVLSPRVAEANKRSRGEL